MLSSKDLVLILSSKDWIKREKSLTMKCCDCSVEIIDKIDYINQFEWYSSNTRKIIIIIEPVKKIILIYLIRQIFNSHDTKRRI